MPECPRCRLISPPESTYCDCGYDFRLRPEEQSGKMFIKPESSAKRTFGVMLLAFSALLWLIYILAWPKDNNLYGVGMMFLIPLTAVMVLVGIMLATARR